MNAGQAKLGSLDPVAKLLFHRPEEGKDASHGFGMSPNSASARESGAGSLSPRHLPSPRRRAPPLASLQQELRQQPTLEHQQQQQQQQQQQPTTRTTPRQQSGSLWWTGGSLVGISALTPGCLAPSVGWIQSGPQTARVSRPWKEQELKDLKTIVEPPHVNRLRIAKRGPPPMEKVAAQEHTKVAEGLSTLSRLKTLQRSMASSKLAAAESNAGDEPTSADPSHLNALSTDQRKQSVESCDVLKPADQGSKEVEEVPSKLKSAIFGSFSRRVKLALASSALRKGSRGSSAAPTDTDPSKAVEIKRRRMGRRFFIQTELARQNDGLMKSVFSSWRESVQVRQRRDKQLNSKHSKQVHEAFMRQVHDGELEINCLGSVYRCIQELGLAGHSAAEHQKVRELCVEVLDLRGSGSQIEPNKKGQGMTESDLVLALLPSIRQSLEAMCAEELQRRLRQLPGNSDPEASAPVTDSQTNRRNSLATATTLWPLQPLDQCARAARLMGVDALLFVKTVKEIEAAKDPGGAKHEEPLKSALWKRAQSMKPVAAPSYANDEEALADSVIFTLKQGQQPPQGPDFSAGRMVSLECCAEAAVRCREVVAKALRSKELGIQAELRLHDAKALALRPQLVEMYDCYSGLMELPGVKVEGHRKRDTVWPESGISRETVWLLLREMALCPVPGSRDFEQLHTYISELDEAVGEKFTFAAVLRVSEKMRRWEQAARHDELTTCFRAACREKAGSLSVAEAAQALAQAWVLPARREEQGDIMSMLAEASGEASDGRISQVAFQSLCLRAQERLYMMQYEAGFAHALGLGFSEADTHDMWEAYQSRAQLGSMEAKILARRRADGGEIGRQASFDQKDQQESQEQPTSQPPGASADTPAQRLEKANSNGPDFNRQASGEPDYPAVGIIVAPIFKSFVSSMSRRLPKPVPPDSGRGLHKKSASKWDSWTIRRALRLLRLSSDYVQSLSSAELPRVLSEYFGVPVSEQPDLDREEILGNLGFRLQAGSPAELHRKAQLLGAQLSQELGWQAGGG